MRLTQLKRADYRRMRWKNGLGWTTEIALEPDGATLAANDFDWRVSIADVDADCQFSPLEGVDRTLMLLDGNGIELRSESSEPVLLNARGRAHDFAGEATVRCRVLDGPSRDFNVMARRGRVEAKTMFRPLVGPMVFFAEPEVSWVVHVVAGHAQIQNAPGRAPLESGDTLLIEPRRALDDTANPEPRQLVVSGGGEVVLVKLARLPDSRDDARTNPIRAR